MASQVDTEVFAVSAEASADVVGRPLVARLAKNMRSRPNLHKLSSLVRTHKHERALVGHSVCLLHVVCHYDNRYPILQLPQKLLDPLCC